NPPTSSSSTANTRPQAPSASISNAPAPKSAPPTANPSTSSMAAAPISGTAASSPPPHVFEDTPSLTLKWPHPRRIFLWQDLNDPIPTLPGKIYFITQSGGKEII